MNYKKENILSAHQSNFKCDFNGSFVSLKISSIEFHIVTIYLILRQVQGMIHFSSDFNRIGWNQRFFQWKIISKI